MFPRFLGDGMDREGTSFRDILMAKNVGEDEEDTFLDDSHDYDEVLSGGPWMVCGHYLVVQPWSQDFSTEETQPWKIRLPGLPYKYYTKGLIRAIAEVLGTPP
ncbi:hypothetical protein Gotri_006404 [Gossypium trilobum]|uniref:DUF4283 domain-containing protein n=1 Tax=Gossypium trilobum TaxID=34281 RepID=A0A7J9EZS1_9ROSI|nr:hypothetical protein [Gossypium trilobum]